MLCSGKFIIAPSGPCDFDSSSEFYRRCRFELADGFGDDWFVRSLEAGGRPVLIRVKTGQKRSDGRLVVEWASPEPAVDRDALRQLLGRVFYLDFDLRAFYRRRLDKVMKGLVTQHYGFRPILTPSLFESAAWAIIGQQVNLPFAFTVKARLVQKIGRSFLLDGRRYFLFPHPEDIADLTYADLKILQFSERKAEYLIDFSRRLADGTIDLEGLRDMEYSKALELLLSIRGFGPWSANYILLRGAGHRDAFPIGDSGINHAISRLYYGGKKPPLDYIMDLGEKWRPYRSLATFYLWKSL